MANRLFCHIKQLERTSIHVLFIGRSELYLSSEDSSRKYHLIHFLSTKIPSFMWELYWIIFIDRIFWLEIFFVPHFVDVSWFCVPDWDLLVRHKIRLAKSLIVCSRWGEVARKSIESAHFIHHNLTLFLTPERALAGCAVRWFWIQHVSAKSDAASRVNTKRNIWKPRQPPRGWD